MKVLCMIKQRGAVAICALFTLATLAAQPNVASKDDDADATTLLTFPIKGLMTVTEDFALLQAAWSDRWLFPSVLSSDSTDGNDAAPAYNHALARVACILSTTSYVAVDAVGHTDALSRCYDVLGVPFSSIEYHYDVDYGDPVWGNDQCAFSFASKDVETPQGTRTIIFVVIRGTPLSANEWISNLDIGEAANGEHNLRLHSGFLRAMQQVLTAFYAYLLERHIDIRTASFLITGHSRGAAVANLLGAQLAENRLFSARNLFVYTFATPNVTTDENAASATYSFIWNIVNAEDIVPCVPLARANWQYRKYGTVLTMANAWNVDADIYRNDYLPRVSAVYQQMLLRDYTPFCVGSFVPVELTRLLSSLNKNEAKYYSRGIGLHSKAEKILWTVFPAEEDGRKPSALGASLTGWVNNLTGGMVDYARLAFADMHANELYLSWMLALDENELFSTLGSTHLLLRGVYEAAVFGADGEVLLRITDSNVHFDSIRRPVVAWQVSPYEIAIGLPANADFTVVVYHSSHFPTRVTATLEHYDACGRLLSTGNRQRLYVHKGMVLRFAAGTTTFTEDTVAAESIRGKTAGDYIKDADLSGLWKLKLLFEVSLSSNRNLSGGVHFGTPSIYGTALLSHRADELNDTLQASAGVGTQQNLWGTFQLDVEGFCHFVQDFDTRLGDGERGFSFVPALRLSLSLKPKKRVQLFGALGCDLHIDDFNDRAFDDALRQGHGGVRFGSSVTAVPTVQMGVRF